MQNKKWLYLFISLLTINLFLYNGQISLWDEDEAAYAGFASTMLETGNWVQPEFLWSHIHRKTPLHFWNIAVAYQVFGVNEWATRLSSALAVLLSCLLLWRWGTTVFGEKTARWSTIVLATSLAVPVTGKMALTDATLLLCQTGAVLALFNYLLHPSWKWNLWFWLFIALGILTKGPIIIILCGGIWMFLLLFHPLRKRLVGTHPWFFGLLALLPLIWWMYLSWQQDDGKLVTFLYHWYILQRVGGSVLGQSAWPGYHLIVILLAFLPWLTFLFPALIRQFRHFFNREQNNLLLSWLLFGWLFFELMRSKLPTYALGAHPAIALLIGRQVVDFLELSDKSFSVAYWTGWLSTLALLLLLGISLPLGVYTFIDDSLLMPYLVFTFVVITLLGIIFFYWRKRNWVSFTYSLALTGTALFFLIITCLLPVLEKSPIKATKKVALRAYELALTKKDNTDAVHVVLMDLGNKQTKVSLPFYLNKYFLSVREEDRNRALKSFLSSTAVILIINPAGLEFITTALESRSVPLPDVKEVDWWSTDDQLRRHEFFILSNF
jgi:4-amino-4-deoxy-L-arabinose transferase-like glycosyltransferase